MIVTWDERIELMRDYLCARCWGLLKVEVICAKCGKVKSIDEIHDPTHGHEVMHRISCEDCGNEDGFVSHQYVTWRQERSLQQYYMAKDALRESIPWMARKPITKEDEKVILAQLGY